MTINWFKRNKAIENQTENIDDVIEKCAVYYISCDKIRSNAMRSRTNFDEDKLITLAYSIKKYGVIQPLCVRKTEEDDIYDYEIIAGERRLRAAKLAGLSTIPCIIMAPQALFAAELSIAENIHSESLNYFEIAAALKRIADHSEDSLRNLAMRLSLTEEALINKAWLLELNFEERLVLLNANVGENLAVSIAKISDKEKRSKIIEYISSTDATESAISSYIEKMDSKPQNDSLKLPRDVSSIVKSISSKVKLLNRRSERGKIKLNNELDGIKIEIFIKY